MPYLVLAHSTLCSYLQCSRVAQNSMSACAAQELFKGSSAVLNENYMQAQVMSELHPPEDVVHLGRGCQWLASLARHPSVSCQPVNM